MDNPSIIKRSAKRTPFTAFWVNVNFFFHFLLFQMMSVYFSNFLFYNFCISTKWIKFAKCYTTNIITTNNRMVLHYHFVTYYSFFVGQKKIGKIFQEQTSFDTALSVLHTATQNSLYWSWRLICHLNVVFEN